MGHEITTTDSALFVGQAAWHGLGMVVPETMSAAEGLTKCGMDWEVCTVPVFAQADHEGMKVMQRIETHRAQVRSDTGSVLGVVGEGFATVQNRELAAMADMLAGEGGCKIESMGSLRGGRRVWILARGESFDIGQRRDEHAPYLCLANGHDGSLSLRVLPTTVRVVCANTLGWALAAGRDAGYTLRHTSGLGLRLDDVRNALRNWRTQIDGDRARSERLSTHRLSREQVQDLWLGAIMLADGPVTVDPKTDADARRLRRAQGAVAHMAKTFDREASLYGANAYTAANAATQWLQHERGRLTGEARAASRLFGDYARMSARVMQHAERMTSGPTYTVDL